MNMLIVSEIFFNIVIPLAILVVSVFAVLVLYYILIIVKDIKKISDNISSASSNMQSIIESIITRLMTLPFISTLIKKKKSKK